jgi:hypothetical protein
MTRIFISYSRKDTDFARKLAGDLEKAGYDVWWDITDIQGGDTWVNSIPDAIETSQYMLVVLSPDSAASPWVQKEYTQALSLRKAIIPLMLEATRIPFALNTIQAIDFTKGHYEDNYKSLLKTLGYTGAAPAVTTFINKRLKQIPALRKYAFPIGVVAVLVIALIAYLLTRPGVVPPPPENTPTNTSELPTATFSPSPTVTTSLTPTDQLSATPTFTPTQPTPTFTPTLPQAFTLPICIYLIDSNANVREGPGTSYDIMGKLDPGGSKCPSFSARIVNEERQAWFQFAPEQQAEFQPYAELWISGSSLAAFDLPRPLPLPICISNPAGSISARILPSAAEEQLGAPLAADGSNCPFFSTRKENSEGIWYQFAPNQKAKVEFQDYAGGWIHEDSLVVRTFTLPVLTLTPTPGLIPTFTPTPSRTPTLTPSPTPTEADTDTPVPTETPTP